ncbi:ABC-type Mn2+/Zn2+ transport systems, permease components [Acetobacter aceti NRIC 0242]|uniref:Uncharacterized protein n=1 Tax=Acetobacter aceti NBRC 14818 TaxID=887700 RepID=A0AB33I8V6_ACEAC|nr:hypothetical protein [Acetobacter aceti]TCS32446.1 hypothetical protein EDC15_1123 [Acetobacter aceti NBRC 14818]BCK74970.1 hypothetical protein EMQ_0576 [Acetobacter aceti NBRC 14818]GAN58967.1 hypothetical protein Abac_194_002 [Acetobacter aceti NBRC 14818]GBO81387.1 ABC-type Mn2+/Zn2+ transport systems, permease components [Acetobacter aceti NRIC 0242]
MIGDPLFYSIVAGLAGLAIGVAGALSSVLMGDLSAVQVHALAARLIVRELDARLGLPRRQFEPLPSFPDGVPDAADDDESEKTPHEDAGARA